MNEKLQKIKARCEWLVDFYGTRNDRAVAGWKSTILICDMLLMLHARYQQLEEQELALMHNIIIAWEGLV